MTKPANRLVNGKLAREMARLTGCHVGTADNYLVACGKDLPAAIKEYCCFRRSIIDNNAKLRIEVAKLTAEIESIAGPPATRQEVLKWQQAFGRQVAVNQKLKDAIQEALQWLEPYGDSQPSVNRARDALLKATQKTTTSA